MKKNMKKAIVRAIDAGYGAFKYTSDVDDSGEVMVDSFPSITSIATSNSKVDGFLQNKNTIDVLHEGMTWSVGKDADLNADGHQQYMLTNQYIKSTQYSVLMKGALKMMGVDEIELLVLGCPVDELEFARQYLEEVWTGDIQLDSEQTIHIKEVMAVAQPVGGYLHFCETHDDFDNLIAARSLVIDPGFYTLDWFMLKSLKEVAGSGSFRGGINAYILAILNEIGINEINFTTIKKVQDCLINKSHFSYENNKYDLSNYLKNASTVVESAVQVMFAKLKDIKNIDHIIVVGGGADICFPFIQNLFSKRVINVAKSKEFANVLGYYYIGITQLESEE